MNSLSQVPSPTVWASAWEADCIDAAPAVTKALFVNSGFLGHRSVARLLADVIADRAEIDASHIDLSDQLTVRERAVRRMMCCRLFGRTGFLGSNLDLARFRGELHSGLLAARRIRAWERRHGIPDVLHFHTQATAYCSLGKMRRTPSIVSIDCTQRLASLEARNRIERSTYWPNQVRDGAVFRRACAITCTSEWAAADLRDCYPDCAHKVHVMPYPVRLNLFDRTWADERAAQRASSPSQPVRVLFIGGDFPRKGGEELLAAWSAAGLADRAELTLVTEYPMQGRILPPGVAQVTGIAAYSDRWRDLWRSTDLFVMPTRGEAFGMVYQEAAAAGVPAIGTRLNAVPEIIDDGITGLLVAPGSVAELTGAVRRLADDAELRHRLGKAARERAERLYAPDRYAGQLSGLLTAAAYRKARS